LLNNSTEVLVRTRKKVCERSGEKDEAAYNNGSNSSQEDDEDSDYILGDALPPKKMMKLLIF
jgi:hypothetical protein